MKFSLSIVLFLSAMVLTAIASMPARAASPTNILDHDYRSILRDIPLRNACVTATEVRSIHPVRTCIQLEPAAVAIPERPNLAPSWTCHQFANVQLVYPRAISTERCVKYGSVRAAEHSPFPECLQTESQTLMLPKTIEVTVSTNDERTSRLDVVRKSFTFPKCK